MQYVSWIYCTSRCISALSWEWSTILNKTGILSFTRYLQRESSVNPAPIHSPFVITYDVRFETKLVTCIEWPFFIYAMFNLVTLFKNLDLIYFLLFFCFLDFKHLNHKPNELWVQNPHIIESGKSQQDSPLRVKSHQQMMFQLMRFQKAFIIFIKTGGRAF